MDKLTEVLPPFGSPVSVILFGGPICDISAADKHYGNRKFLWKYLCKHFAGAKGELYAPMKDARDVTQDDLEKVLMLIVLGIPPGSRVVVGMDWAAACLLALHLGRHHYELTKNNKKVIIVSSDHLLSKPGSDAPLEWGAALSLAAYLPPSDPSVYLFKRGNLLVVEGAKSVNYNMTTRLFEVEALS